MTQRGPNHYVAYRFYEKRLSKKTSRIPASGPCFFIFAEVLGVSAPLLVPSRQAFMATNQAALKPSSFA